MKKISNQWAIDVAVKEILERTDLTPEQQLEEIFKAEMRIEQSGWEQPWGSRYECGEE